MMLLMFQGLGTDDQALIRVMVSRCEVDMGNIKQSFAQQYGKQLSAFIAVSHWDMLEKIVDLVNYTIRISKYAMELQSNWINTG